MSVQRVYNLDLSSSAIRKFAIDKIAQVFEEVIVAPLGYEFSKSNQKIIGRLEKDDLGKDLSLNYVFRENYDVIEGYEVNKTGTVLSSISADIYLRQKISIEIIATLLIKKGIIVESASKIVSSFENFVADGSTDPDDYMTDLLRKNNDLSAAMFKVVITSKIKKIDEPIANTEERDAKLQMYRGGIEGSVCNEDGSAPSIQGENGYYTARKIDIKLTNVELFDHIPEKYNSEFEIEVEESAVYKTFENIMNSKAEAIGCSTNDYDMIDHRIATLLKIPEFKIDWRNFVINIGCGVQISLYLPVLQIRWSNLDLHSIIRFPKNLGQLAIDGLVDCLWKAAFAGAVIGVAFGNFAAAVYAFKSLFTECLKSKFKHFITCMIPALGLNKVVQQDWASI